jgi:protein-L-isoaspartate O-methyltransferase
MSEIKVGDGVTGKVVTLDANWSLNWHQHLQCERDEQEAAFQFVPAEHVAHLKHKTRADLRIEAKVRYETIGKFPWSAMMMQRLGDREAMHTLRSGCEDSYRAACLAALTAAKDLANGE